MSLNLSDSVNTEEKTRTSNKNYTIIMMEIVKAPTPRLKALKYINTLKEVHLQSHMRSGCFFVRLCSCLFVAMQKTKTVCTAESTIPVFLNHTQFLCLIPFHLSKMRTTNKTNSLQNFYTDLVVKYGKNQMTLKYG